MGEQIGQIRQDLAAVRETGSALWEPYFLALLADVYAQEGQVEAGLATLAEALAAAQATGERWAEAELYRLRGSLLLQQTGTPQAEVETWLQRALDVARRQEARSLELRAAMSLSISGTSRGNGRRRTTCWLRSTRGLPRALTLPISRRPRRCSRS
jgi:predicted ATPase